MDLGCYYCEERGNDPNRILNHLIKMHDNCKVSLRQYTVDDKTGDSGYKVVHFNVNVFDIRKNVLIKPYFISENSELKLKYKRFNDCEKRVYEEKEDYVELMKSVLDRMDTIDRKRDFISLVRSIADGRLDIINIA